ncbi:hypothetical protein V6615_05715 [Oscillospiraceae bacterium PP1C4]
MDLFAQTAAAGLYDLREGSMVTCELKACQAGLDLLEKQLAPLENASVVSTMSTAQLTQICDLFGFAVSPEITAAALRGYVEILLRGCGKCTTAAIQTYLRGLGAQITLIEQPEKRRLLVGGTQLSGLCASSEVLHRILCALLPVGVESVLSLGSLSWEMLDAGDLSTAALDKKDFTWEWFDLNGHLLLGEEQSNG